MPSQKRTAATLGVPDDSVDAGRQGLADDEVPRTPTKSRKWDGKPWDGKMAPHQSYHAEKNISFDEATVRAQGGELGTCSNEYHGPGMDSEKCRERLAEKHTAIKS